MAPTGLAIDKDRNLYIVDWIDNRVRKVTPDGIITTVAGTGKQGFSGDGGQAREAMLKEPFLVTVDSAGNLFVGDWLNYRLRKITPDGVITTIAGKGRGMPAGDGGPATEATLAGPMGMVIDAEGNLIFSDYNSGFDKNDKWEDPRILMIAGAAAPGLIGGKPFPKKP
jgi:hypothetical protein